MDNTFHCINNIYYFLNSSNDTRERRDSFACASHDFTQLCECCMQEARGENTSCIAVTTIRKSIFHLIVREMNCAWRGICCALLRRYYTCIYNSCKIEICLQFTWIALRDMFALIEDMTTQFARRCIRPS